MTTSSAHPSEPVSPHGHGHDPRDANQDQNDGADQPLSPAESLALIDAQRRTAARRLRPNPLGLYLPWGLAYLVAFGATWLSTGPGAVLPRPVTAVLVVLCLAGPTISVFVTLTRSHWGVEGPSRRVSVLYGWSWFLGFTTVWVSNARLDALGVPGPVMSLVWSSTALLVVGLLMLAGGVLWPGGGQYPLGVWILVTSVASVFVGFPANFLVLAFAGGGGFVVLALVARARCGWDR